MKQENSQFMDQIKKIDSDISVNQDEVLERNESRVTPNFNYEECAKIEKESNLKDE